MTKPTTPRPREKGRGPARAAFDEAKFEISSSRAHRQESKSDGALRRRHRSRPPRPPVRRVATQVRQACGRKSRGPRRGRGGRRPHRASPGRRRDGHPGSRRGRGPGGIRVAFRPGRSGRAGPVPQDGRGLDEAHELHLRGRQGDDRRGRVGQGHDVYAQLRAEGRHGEATVRVEEYANNEKLRAAIFTAVGPTAEFRAGTPEELRLAISRCSRPESRVLSTVHGWDEHFEQYFTLNGVVDRDGFRPYGADDPFRIDLTGEDAAQGLGLMRLDGDQLREVMEHLCDDFLQLNVPVTTRGIPRRPFRHGPSWSGRADLPQALLDRVHGHDRERQVVFGEGWLRISSATCR